MKPKRFGYPAAGERMCGTQAAAAGAIKASDLFEATLGIVLLVGYWFVTRHKHNGANEGGQGQYRQEFPPTIARLRRGGNGRLQDGRFAVHVSCLAR